MVDAVRSDRWPLGECAATMWGCAGRHAVARTLTRQLVAVTENE